MDQDLVVRAQGGDQRAFETLTASEHPRLFRVAHGILGDPHLAEDATQQAFLDIWRNIPRLRDPAKFEGWSYRVLVHACYATAPMAGGSDDPEDEEENVVLFATEAAFEIIRNAKTAWWLAA